jgi:hypothetical protein
MSAELLLALAIAAAPPRSLLAELLAGSPGRADVAARPSSGESSTTPDAPRAVQLAQGAQKRVYIACDDHTDYMWTADEATYRAAFQEMIDYYSALADATASNAPEYRSKFNVDGSYWLRVYEEERTPAEFDALMERIKLGQFTAPLTPIVTLYGSAPAEDVLRTMYYAGHLERRYDVRFPLVITMENQVVPRGLPSLFAGSGAKWSWKGICGCGSKVEDAWNREHDIYWWTGADGQRILMKWNSMLAGNESLGGYAEARVPGAAVNYVTTNAPFNGFAARYPYDVIGAFGKGWDDLKTLTSEFVTVAQSMSNATRQVIVSNEVDFFNEFEATYGAGLPSESLAYGNEWELYLASLAETSASVKRAIEGLRNAEAMAAVVSLADASFMDPFETARDEAWERLGLYHDHDWTADGGISKNEYAAYQKGNAATVTDYVDTLHSAALAALGERVAAASGTSRFVVFNGLSFPRTDAVDLPVVPIGAFHVVEVPGEVEVPSQTVTVNGVTVTRILAGSVPGLGYRTYELRSGAGQTFSPAAIESGGGGRQPITVEIPVEDDLHDAMSNAVPGGHQVRVAGYSVAEPIDFVGTDGDQQTSAMSFAVDIPEGATVLAAAVTVRTSPGASGGSTGSLRIRAYDLDDTPPFVDLQPVDLAALHPTVGSVLWPTAGWPLNANLTSPDITSLVQQHIDRPGYLPGNHLGLVVDEGTLAANLYYGWHDFHAGSSLVPTLAITYLPPDGVSGGVAGGTGLTYETSRHRVTVDGRGAITSLVDRDQGDREFASVIGGRALNDLGPGGGTLTIENAGPVSLTIKAVSASPLAHTSRITLYRDGERIDIDNRITQTFGAVQTWGFAFATPSPIVRHEEVGAINVAKLTSQGGNYATGRARYDWLTLNHFVDVRGADGAGVTLANSDCLFFQLGNSSPDFLDAGSSLVKVLAGGQVDGSGLGIQNQDGDALFTQRFGLATSASYDQAGAMRAALVQQNPLVATLATGGPAATLPVGSHSFLSVSDPNVLVWALKPAEEGIEDGVIVRLWNLGSSATSTTVTAAGFHIAEARRTTHIETDEEIVPVSQDSVQADFTAQQMKTYRLLVGPSCAVADLNCDGAVNGADLAILLGGWGTANADLDGDGATNGADLAILLGSWTP